MSSPDPDRPNGGDVLPQLRTFMRDFAAYAGRKGVFAAISVALGALLEGLSLALIVPLLGIVTGSGTPFGRLERFAAPAFDLFHADTPFGRLAVLLLFFGVLMVLRAVVISLRDVTVARLQVGFVETQRLRIAQSLAAASWDQVVRLRHARITHLMSGDIQRIGLAANVLLRCAVAAAMLLAHCVLVLLLSPALGALALAILALSIVVFVPYIRRAHEVGGVVTQGNLTLLDATAQFLGGLKLAMSQNLQASFLTAFRSTLHGLSTRQVDFQRQQTNSRLAFSTLSALAAGVLVLVGFGAFAVSPPTLIALLLVIGRMGGPAMQIQQGAQQLVNALPAYSMVKELESELAAIAPRGHAMPAEALAIPAGPIVFDKVSYLHAGDDDVRGLRGISLVIEPGDFVGIGGSSGAGKTTFADLLVGLIAPQEGHIAVGATALEGAALAGWRDGIAYVSQDAFLFHDSVRRNLSWANQRASEDEMWSALALAGADTVVRRMERGLETVVGERGTLVSGGERQRLALARALLRKPRLLVLDEATSAIDVAGERAILERLRVLNPRPTIVVIAHRAESLSLCDRVLAFEAGRLT